MIAPASLPAGFPLSARDRFDQPVAIGDVVRILSVTSCLKGMSDAERVTLRSCVGETRTIARIDPHGFLWFSFGAAVAGGDFSLFPGEVTSALSWSGRKTSRDA